MKLLSVAVGVSCLLWACASNRPDHFYILSEQPSGQRAPRTSPLAHVTLVVMLPSLVDRSEMVVNTSAEGVSVLEHERWAAPLPDLFLQTLGEDIEGRRPDVLVGGRNTAHAGSMPIRVVVDVVQVSMRRADRAGIEAHWRISQAPDTDITGSELLTASLAGNEYGDVARALSECVAQLADRLAGQLPHQQ